MPPASTGSSPLSASDKASRLGLAAVVAGSVFLALGPWMVRSAPVDPVAAAFWRMVLAAPLLLGLAWLVARRTGVRDPKTGWGPIILAGFCFAADLAVWHIGMTKTTLANASLLSNTTTLLLAAYAVIVLRERPSRGVSLALGLALVGIVLLGSGREGAAGVAAGPDKLLGDLLCLAAAVFYTGYLVVLSRARAQVSALGLLARVSPVGAAFLLPMALVAPGPLLPPTGAGWMPLMGLALGSQVLGQGLILYGFGRTSPIIGGLALLVQPLIGALIGWAMFNERLGPWEGLGALLLIGALILVRLVPAPRV